jgi:hypothetical protein
VTDIDRIAHTLAVTNERADMWKARAVAAETALAEATREIERLIGVSENRYERLGAAERRANDLADALREIADSPIARPPLAKDQLVTLARAALDRHTHQHCTCPEGADGATCSRCGKPEAIQPHKAVT